MQHLLEQNQLDLSPSYFCCGVVVWLGGRCRAMRSARWNADSIEFAVRQPGLYANQPLRLRSSPLLIGEVWMKVLEHRSRESLEGSTVEFGSPENFTVDDIDHSRNSKIGSIRQRYLRR